MENSSVGRVLNRPKKKGTSISLAIRDASHPFKVIEEYDKRADSENLIGEAKREGLAAIVSTNYAYFQMVMLFCNIWRSFKMLAGHSLRWSRSNKQKERNLSLLVPHKK